MSKANFVADASISLQSILEKVDIDFEWAQLFRGIVVTGCQRSGTGIASRIIAHDLNRLHIDEDDYGTKQTKVWKERVVTEQQPFVIHSPAMSRYLTDVVTDDILVVYMRRRLRDVERSIRRIEWDDANERTAYKDTFSNEALHIYKIKMKYWKRAQQKSITNWIEINYEALGTHPLWINKSERLAFNPRQWK